eukprot:INCI16580.2.p1 GENE.INCI16580.2~~INCI16580.2.p1  ORF type:complete len:236 (-),score=33.33 INCI16580.2:284-991(-)
MTVSTLVRVAVAAAVATVVAKRGVKKKSLSVAGARAAFAVGFVSLALSYRFGLTLIAFYYTSSRLTKWRAEEKQKLEADFEKESQRGVAQVLSSSIVGCVIAACYAAHAGADAALSFRDDWLGAWLLAAYLGHYACCAGDTWASEVGILDTCGLPRLALAPWRSVPKGTNGGMSVVGTAASLAGGLFMGFSFALLGSLFVGAEAFQLGPLVCIGGFAGFVGSLLDSMLGQLFQAS